MKRNKGTVAKIVKEMRYKADRADFDCCGNVDASFVRIFADRVENAYERDVAKLRECLEEAVSARCHECFHSDHGRCEAPYVNCMAKKWRKALAGAAGKAR